MARRFEEMKFANSGPFNRFLDSRIGRSFVKPSRDSSGKIVAKSYSATSAEDYSIGAALSQKTVTLPSNLVEAGMVLTQLEQAEMAFGREQDSSGRRPRRRGGRGRKKVTA